jgi:hypothetical protein
MGITVVLSILSGSLFALSEFMSLNKKIKSNGIIQSFINLISKDDSEINKRESSDIFLRIKNDFDYKSIKLILEKKKCKKRK